MPEVSSTDVAATRIVTMSESGTSPIPLLPGTTLLWEISLDTSEFSAPPPGTRDVILSLGRSRGVWLPSEVAAAGGALDAAIAVCRDAGVRPLIKPDAFGFPTDVPSTLTFLRTRENLGLCVEPAALFTESMIGDCAIHLERFAHGFHALESLAMVLLSDVRFAGNEAALTDLGGGVLGTEALTGWAAGVPHVSVFRVARSMP
jgi:hypothetical protein